MKASAHDKIICGIIFSVFFRVVSLCGDKRRGLVLFGLLGSPFWLHSQEHLEKRQSFLPNQGNVSRELRLGRIRYGERTLACWFTYRFFRASHYLVGFRGDLIRIPQILRITPTTGSGCRKYQQVRLWDLVYEDNADWRGNVYHRPSLVGQSSGGLIYAVGGDGVRIGACGQ